MNRSEASSSNDGARTQISNGKGPPSTLTLLFLTLIAAVYIGATVFQPAEVYDEGLIVSGAEQVLHGHRPYLDFNTAYPPGQFYTIAFVFRMFGEGLLVERIWDSIWRWGIVVASFWLVYELWGQETNPLPLLCCITLVGGIGFRLYPLVTATLPCLCALSCTLRFLKTRNLHWIFGSGLLLGCTALYRHDLAVCAGIAVLGSVLRNRAAIICLIGGTLLIIGPIVAYLLITIPRHVLWQSFFEFPKVQLAARHIPLHFYLKHDRLRLLSLVLSPLVIMAFAATRALHKPAGGRSPIVILVVTASLTWILATQRLDTAHAFPSLMICLILLAGEVRSNIRIMHGMLIALATLFYGFIPAQAWVHQLQSLKPTQTSAIARADSVAIAPDQADAVRYLQDHLLAGNKVYVGTTSHSRIFINDALFPFLAERPLATRHYMWVPGVTNSVPVQSEIVKELKSNNVQYVVLFDAPTSTEENLSSVDSGVTLLDDYLKRNYREVAVSRRYHILQRVF